MTPPCVTATTSPNFGNDSSHSTARTARSRWFSPPGGPDAHEVAPHRRVHVALLTDEFRAQKSLEFPARNLAQPCVENRLATGKNQFRSLHRPFEVGTVERVEPLPCQTLT